jgi:hypothetical protein
VNGYRVSQAIYVALRLASPTGCGRLPNERGPGRATETNEPALYRVLRFLAGVGLFDEVGPRRFGLTALGAGLRGDVPGLVRLRRSVRRWRIRWQAGTSCTPCGPADRLQPRRRDGTSTTCASIRTARAIFNQRMTSNTRRPATGRAGLRLLRRSAAGRRRGRHGLLLATILQAHPSCAACCSTSPRLAGAPQRWSRRRADRCEVVGGPLRGLLARRVRPAQIIHDWDDERALAILASCRRAVGRPEGKVLVVERAIAPDHRQGLAELALDLQMLVGTGGLQRTEAEYGALFAAAGLRLSAVIPLGDPRHYSIYEGVPA